MLKKHHAPQTIKGYRLPAPKLTRGGYRAIALYLIAPFLGLLFLLDALLYLLFRFGFDRCYGILCWL